MIVMNAALRNTHMSVLVVTAAPRIQELAIEHSQAIGSHVFFPGRVVSDETLAGRGKA